MRKWMVLALITCVAGPAYADAASEARAAGQASISAINGGLQSDQQWTAPAVTALPGGTMPQATASGAEASSIAMAAQCATNPSAHVECEAINAASANMQPASTYQAAMSGYTDADLLRSGQISFSDEEGLGIGGTYSCTTSTETTGSYQMYAILLQGLQNTRYDCLPVDDQVACCRQGTVLTRISQYSGGIFANLDPVIWRCVDNTNSSDNWRSNRVRWLDPSDSRIQVEDNTSQQTVTTCESQPQTTETGAAWDPGNEADSDLAEVVAYMEAGREAGGYMDPDTLEIFKGYKSTCKKKLFGAVNCCAGGSGSGSAFSNSAIGVMSTAGNAMASTYTYDALFASQAPDMVIAGFSTLFGSGTNSALAGMLAGDVSVEGFLSSLVPGPWTIAMMALQFSGLMDCSQNDQETAMRKDAKLCVSLGSYCSKKVLFGSCLERKQSYCCFNSVLAKLINKQGKAQLGRSMGSAKHPNCSGFTPAELQQLDLSAMDLTEFMEQVMPETDTPGATSCYFHGDTSCPAVH